MKQLIPSRNITLKGFCNRGENCRFAHSSEELRPNPLQYTKVSLSFFFFCLTQIISKKKKKKNCNLFLF